MKFLVYCFRWMYLALPLDEIVKMWYNTMKYCHNIRQCKSFLVWKIVPHRYITQYITFLKSFFDVFHKEIVWLF